MKACKIGTYREHFPGLQGGEGTPLGWAAGLSVADTSYEIYVRQKGSDRWMLDSRYGTSDKQEAIDDAKEIARQTHIEAVRVVREIHNPETNTTRDTVVFTTSGKKGADGGGPKRRGDDDDEEPSPGRRSSPSDDDYDGPPSDDDDEPSPKRGWFKRKAKDEDGDDDEGKPAAAPAAAKPPPRPRSPAFRAYMTVVKFVVIVMVSFGFATASTFVYVRFLA